MPTWTFLSNHALVLLTIANDPGIRLRDIGDQVGITERAAHRIVTELDEGGYLVREREGRRNRYTISGELPIPGPLARDQKLGDLLTVLLGDGKPIADGAQPDGVGAKPGSDGRRADGDGRRAARDGRTSARRARKPAR